MQKIIDLKFNVLSKLKPEIISNIRLVYIFGEIGSEVLFVNNDDKVFSFGNNKSGLLGLVNTKPIQEVAIVPELCDIHVENIRAGYDFVLALTKCGHLYSWGNNKYGQLGNGSQIANYIPMINKTFFESNANVVDMSCGYYHSLILTNMGEVYGFGYNNNGEIGCGNNKNQLIPIKIDQTFFTSEKVISISCGGHHSLSLTKSGCVFSWGYNSHCQLGIGNNIDHNIPVKIESINNCLFKKISCGYTYSLLLSNDGCIYSFGQNKFGQIGNGNKVNQNFPLKLEQPIKFNDIASDSLSHISIATAMNGNCYVWGECVNGVVITPKETQFKSIHDIFAKYGKRKITYKPFVVENKIKENRILKKFANFLNNPERSDLKLKIDNNFIYTHKWLLKNFFESFTSLLPTKWLETDTNEIELTQYSYNVYYSCFKYFYTDSVDIATNESIDLLDLANRLDEEELKINCIELIKESISDENICSIYSAAVKYSSEELENFCLKFSSNKLSQICKSDAFKEMDETSRSKFIIRAAEMNLIK